MPNAPNCLASPLKVVAVSRLPAAQPLGWNVELTLKSVEYKVRDESESSASSSSDAFSFDFARLRAEFAELESDIVRWESAMGELSGYNELEIPLHLLGYVVEVIATLRDGWQVQGGHGHCGELRCTQEPARHFTELAYTGPRLTVARDRYVRLGGEDERAQVSRPNERPPHRVGEWHCH